MKLYSAPKNKKVAYLMLALLLPATYSACIKADDVQTESGVAAQQPEAIIEEIVTTCLSDREYNRSFFYFIAQIIEVINQHKAYFTAKYGDTTVNGLLKDLPKLKLVKSIQQVQAILEKYKGSINLFNPENNHKRSTFNQFSILCILQRRMKIAA